MYIVAIAWIYVVFMMSITEESVVAGVMTFVLYGILPLTIILYIMGTSQRKRRRAALAAAGSDDDQEPGSGDTSSDSTIHGTSDSATNIHNETSSEPPTALPKSATGPETDHRS